MTKDIFISYSRRDQEFVRRLAGDLNAQVAGVWFDQSTIQLGQKWHDEIMDGIRECKAFILVLSPDAAESKYVREEVNKALELGKTIFPILYRPGKWTGEFDSLVKEVQTLDLPQASSAPKASASRVTLPAPSSPTPSTPRQHSMPARQRASS